MLKGGAPYGSWWKKMSQMSLFLVGGTGLFRRGLNSFLQNTDFVITAEYDTAPACVAAAGASEDPDLIVFISSGNVEESQQTVEDLADAFPDTRLVVLSGELSVDELAASLKAGARGYLLSSISKEAMVHSLTLINLGETVFPSGLALAWMSGGVSANRTLTDRSAGRDLTRREAEILDCLTAGASNKQIARDLGITEATVKIHMKSLIRKIGVRNRTQAALWAINTGFGQEIARAAA
jgi:DNA-binding NarL/FixJ family response regulator